MIHADYIKGREYRPINSYLSTTGVVLRSVFSGYSGGVEANHLHPGVLKEGLLFIFQASIFRCDVGWVVF